MKKITLISVVVSLLLTAGACLIAMRAACQKHGPIGRTQELVEKLDSTYCEEHIFPMVVRDLRRASLLNAYRWEGEVTQGDTIRGGGLFRPELGMKLTIYLAVGLVRNFVYEAVSGLSISTFQQF